MIIREVLKEDNPHLDAKGAFMISLTCSHKTFYWSTCLFTVTIYELGINFKPARVPINQFSE
jgi:hypothetical protein